MLLTLLLLCGSALLGIGIVHRTLPQILNRIEQVLYGAVLGWSMSTLTIYLVARWQLRLTAISVAWVTTLSFVAALALLAPTFRHFNKLHFAWRPQFAAHA